MAKLQHTRSTGRRLTYEIEADQMGNWSVSLDGVVLRRGREPLVVLGMLRPSAELERDAIMIARDTIERLVGMGEAKEHG